MLKHIVMWHFKDGAEGKRASEHAAHMKVMLDALVGRVPAIRQLECGTDVMHTPASADLVLTVTVDDADALQQYAQHPDHLAVAEYAKRVTETRTVVDYLIP